MIRLVGNVDALNNCFANASRYESIHALLVELRGNLEAVSDWFRGAVGDLAGYTGQFRAFPADVRDAENFTGELIGLAGRIYSNLLVLVHSWDHAGSAGTLLSTPVMAAKSHLPLVHVSEYHQRSERLAFVPADQEYQGKRVKATKHIRPIPSMFTASAEVKANLVTVARGLERFHPLAINNEQLNTRAVNCAKAAVAYFKKLVEDNAGTKYEADWRKRLADAEYKLGMAVERSQERAVAVRDATLANHMPAPSEGVTAAQAAYTWNNEWKGQRAKRMPFIDSHHPLVKAVGTINRTVSLIVRKGVATADQVTKVTAALEDLIVHFTSPEALASYVRKDTPVVIDFAKAVVDVLHAFG